MRRLIRTVLALIGVCVVAAGGRADPLTKEDRLKAVKQACAVIELRGGPGPALPWSAFAIGRDSYFVTATGYDFQPAAGAKLWVTLHAGDKGEKRFEGIVVRTDPMAGLAVVRAKGAGEVPPMTLGDDDKVGELDDLTAFGAPFIDFSKLPITNEGQRQFPPKTLAEVKVSVAGRVLDSDKKPVRFSLDKPGVKGKLVVGGPAVNDKGEVVGLLAPEGPNAHPLTAIGAVVSIRAVNKFLEAAPVLDFETAEIDPKARFDSATVRAGLFAGLGKPDGYTVELTVRSGGRERKVEMKAAGDGFEAGVAPFEKTDQLELLTAEIAFPDSRPRLPIADAAFKVGGKEYRLSEVIRVRFGKGGGVNTLTGSATGEVTGLDELAVRIGGQAFSLKTASATELTVRLRAEPKDAYRMTAVAKKDGKEVARTEEVRFLKGTAPSGFDGLRMGYLVKPLAGDAPKSFARVLMPGEDEPQEFTAEQMTVAAIAGTDESRKSGIGSVIVSLYPSGWKAPQPGDPHRPGAFDILFRLQFSPPMQKLLVTGDWRDTGPLPNSATAHLAASGIGMPTGGNGFGGFRRPGLPAPAPASATFAVYELEADRDGKLTKFAADFVYFSPGQDKPVIGVIRVNSKFQ